MEINKSLVNLLKIRMARNSDDLPLKKVIENLFKETQQEDKFIETKIPTIWNEAVGTYIADRTTNIFVKNHTLFVYLSSAPLKQEMGFNKDKIIALINEKLQSNYVKSIQIR